MKLPKMSCQLHELQFQDVMLIFLEVKILKKNSQISQPLIELKCSNAPLQQPFRSMLLKSISVL